MKIFLVGGAVRDQLLQFPFSERDWVVVGATPEQMCQQGFRPVGKDFPVFLHPETQEEYALARTERKTAPGYRGFTFHTDPSVTLAEDLKRRDLTINAIAQDNSGQLIDPYGGQQDLNNKTLRHVSAAFSEDPVRILRCARFAARYHHLGFRLAPETQALMQTMVSSGETRHLVPERIWQECHKALGEKHPDIFFSTLEACGALVDIFPEISAQSTTDPLADLRIIQQHTNNPLLRFTALCQHLEAAASKHLCTRLGTPNRFSELALLASSYSQKIVQAQQLSAEAIAEVLKRCDSLRKPERFEQLILCIALISTPQAPQALTRFWQTAVECYQRVEPQALIAKGYSKAALGQAIQQERIHQLTHYLNTL